MMTLHSPQASNCFQGSFFFFLSLYVFPPKGALGYEAVSRLVIFCLSLILCISFLEAVLGSSAEHVVTFPAACLPNALRLNAGW